MGTILLFHWSQICKNRYKYVFQIDEEQIFRMSVINAALSCLRCCCVVGLLNHLVYGGLLFRIWFSTSYNTCICGQAQWIDWCFVWRMVYQIPNRERWHLCNGAAMSKISFFFFLLSCDKPIYHQVYDTLIAGVSLILQIKILVEKFKHFSQMAAARISVSYLTL